MMQTVVIYRVSLALSSVGASLSALPGLEIQRVEAQAESDRLLVLSFQQQTALAAADLVNVN